MNENCSIAIYYIATGKYKDLFPDFLESLQNFFPKNKKTVKLISDGLTEFASYEKGNVKVDLCPRINNYPWPIITLYKMWHIAENFDSSFDYSCYINANAIIHEHSNDVFNLDKINLSYHGFLSNKYYYNIWDHIHINPHSCAYLENETYEYVQGGFFFGPSNMIFNMCNDIVNMVREDSRHFIFAQWHDESYLNKWAVLNADLVDKKYIFTIYEDELDLHRFIFLRDKRAYEIIK